MNLNYLLKKFSIGFFLITFFSGSIMSMTCHWRGVDWPAKCHKHYQIKLDHDKYHSKHHKSFSALFAFICRHNISHSHPSTTVRARNFPRSVIGPWPPIIYSHWSLLTRRQALIDKVPSIYHMQRHLDCRSISKHFLVFSSLLGLRSTSCWWWTKVD